MNPRSHTEMQMRSLIFGLGLMMLPAALSANSLTCSSLGIQVGNTCDSNTTFTNTLLWTAFGAAFESDGDVPIPAPASNPSIQTSWSATSGGNTVTATTNAGDLQRVDEAPYVYVGNFGGWVIPGAEYCTNGPCVLHGFSGTGATHSYAANIATVQGNFDFSTNTSPTFTSTSTDANLALLETYGSSTSMTLSFSHNIEEFGVDISSLEATNFTATITAYDGATQVGTYSLNTNGNNLGGTCTSLDSPPSAGSGCNDAPFIGYGSPSSVFNKVVISVTNNSGGGAVSFAIDSLQFSGSSAITTPEPNGWLLTLTALGAFLVIRVLRRRRQQSIELL